MYDDVRCTLLLVTTNSIGCELVIHANKTESTNLPEHGSVIQASNLEAIVVVLMLPVVRKYRHHTLHLRENNCRSICYSWYSFARVIHFRRVIQIRNEYRVLATRVQPSRNDMKLPWIDTIVWRHRFQRGRFARIVAISSNYDLIIDVHSDQQRLHFLFVYFQYFISDVGLY